MILVVRVAIEDRLQHGGVPDFDRLVDTAGDQVPVRRMGDGIDATTFVLIFDLLQQRSFRHIPQPKRITLTAEDEGADVGGEGERLNAISDFFSFKLIQNKIVFQVSLHGALERLVAAFGFQLNETLRDAFLLPPISVVHIIGPITVIIRDLRGVVLAPPVLSRLDSISLYEILLRG